MTIKTGIPVLLCGLVFLGAASAQAQTREEVLSGIQRCGVIHDDRTWLDCLYGADQPMRARLGLPPAPEFQQRLVPSGPVMPMSAMPLPVPPADTAPPPPRIASRPATPRKPSFWSTLVGTDKPYAVSRMASYRYEKNGAFVVTLENGQQWRQINVNGDVHASWPHQPSSYTVTITQGMSSTFILHTDDSPNIYKVEMVH